MALLAIAYPEIVTADLELIQQYRCKYDKLYYDIVGPHFTLVFPIHEQSQAAFVSEIKKQLSGMTPISFCFKKAVVHKDELSDMWFSFLVPDEGFANIKQLHDKLYGDKFSQFHRRDIEYVPHITIGHFESEAACNKIVREWNSNEPSIKGIISSVDIVSFGRGKVSTIERVAF